MKSIWYIVGSLLTIMGAIFAGAAVCSVIYPPAQPEFMSHLHPDLWRGIFMLIFGLAFAISNRRNVVH
jgi:hypothetical protein